MFRHIRCIAPTIALMLTLAVAGPASARSNLGQPAATTDSSTPNAGMCSEVCSAGGYAAAKTGAALPHDPRARSVALAAAGYGYGKSPIARVNDPRSEVVSGGGYGNPNSRVTIVRVAGPSNGFDWGDAGIGAGATLALLTLVVGGLLAMTGARRRATGGTA